MEIPLIGFLISAKRGLSASGESRDLSSGPTKKCPACAELVRKQSPGNACFELKGVAPLIGTLLASRVR